MPRLQVCACACVQLFISPILPLRHYAYAYDAMPLLDITITINIVYIIYAIYAYYARPFATPPLRRWY